MTMLLRVLVVCLFTLSLSAQATRLSWETFSQDPGRVQSLRNAVAAMKARNTADKNSAEYRLSWEYWANMHGYFGQAAKNGTVLQWRTKNKLLGPEWDPYFAGVQNTATFDSISSKVWDQCQHGTDWFFPWHRLYLFYFEQVLQDAAGDPTLRLPYWDYTDPAHLAMPAEFTTETYVNGEGRTVANPLYEPRRLPGWNVPSTNKLDSTSTNIDQALDIESYLDTVESQKTVPGYQSTIEGTPHGYVHCSVMQCRATVMGAVPYSSNDPIFYLHHCNIDRLWKCWENISGHQNPTGTWQQKQFSYVDRTGALVTKQVSVLFTPGFIDYVYERPSNCARPATTPAVVTLTAESAATQRRNILAARAALARPVRIGGAQRIAVNATVTRVPVSLPATASLAHPRQFALREQAQLAVATDLLLRGVRFRAHPGARIRVFLTRTDGTRRVLVGTMSFFSQEPAGEPAHHAPNQSNWRFDASHALRALGLEGTGTHNLHVVFEVVDEPIGADFDPAAAGVMVDEIELRVRRDV